MPSFHHKSKVTSRRIFVVEIGTLLECLRKAQIGTTPFQNQTSKPLRMQSPKSQCQNHVFTANLQKLRFNQNKGLSLGHALWGA